MNENDESQRDRLSRKQSLVNLARAVMTFSNLLAMPYYIRVANEVLGADGLNARRVGIVACIIGAASWLLSWRVGLAVQVLVVLASVFL